MSESTLSLKYADLLSEVAAFLGYGGVPDAWSTEQAAEVDRYVQSGYRQFLYPASSPASIVRGKVMASAIEAGYVWSFLNPTTTIDTADGDAAQDLPDTLGRIVGDLTFAATEFASSVVLVSEHRIAALLEQSAEKGRPRYAAVRAKDGTTLTTGQRFEIVWWPIPDAVYTLTYRYEGYTGKLTNDRPYPLGGMKHAETIIESCLAVAEQRANDERGQHSQLFTDLLITSIELDRKQGARYFGSMGSPERGAIQDSAELPRYPNGNVTYKGVTW